MMMTTTISVVIDLPRQRTAPPCLTMTKVISYLEYYTKRYERSDNKRSVARIFKIRV